MMRVIGINGSPRKHANSASMLEYFLKGASQAEIKRYDLFDYHFSGCQSCFACKLINGKSFGKCALHDDLTMIIDDIFKADVLGITMPIYFGDVPGTVRNLMERLWFPGLMYRKDGKIAYDHKMKVVLIYTMNVTDSSFYKELIESHKKSFERFFGEVHILCATDTLQFSNYQKYASEMFDEKKKIERHQTIFKEELNKAYELGKMLVEYDEKNMIAEN